MAGSSRRPSAAGPWPCSASPDPRRRPRAGRPAALAVRDPLAGARRPGELRVQAAVATGEALVRPGGGAGGQRVAGDPVGPPPASRRPCRPGPCWCRRRPGGPPSGRSPTARPAGPARGRRAAARLAGAGPRAGPASPSRRFPLLVARDRELETLLAAAARARDGGGPELVTIVGAAGIGKSRLLAELADRLAARDRRPRGSPGGRGGPCPTATGRPSGRWPRRSRPRPGSWRATAPSWPGGGWWRPRRRWPTRSPPPGSPAISAGWSAWAGRRRSAGLTTAADREEEFAAWRRFLHGLAATRPLVLALEDLHRADDALLDFVEGLVDRDAGPAAMLVLATARPELLERRPGWGAGGTTVRLGPLGDPDTTGLLATLLAHHGLPAEVDPALLGRVGGNPLFAEEYVRMLRDRGDGGPAAAAAPLPLPTGVHAIVAARLDALPAADKAVLHDAAVLGQVGWLGALAEISGHDHRRAGGLPARLEAREFLQRAPASRVAGEVEYAFRHTLVRDVAYGQVLRAERAGKHRRAAEWIEALAPDRAEGRAELLAYHYRAALSFARAAGTEPPGLAARALGALRDAGDRAAALGGWETAARFLAEALELTPAGDPGRGQLLLGLGRARCRGEMTPAATS